MNAIKIDIFFANVDPYSTRVLFYTGTTCTMYVYRHVPASTLLYKAI